MDDKKLEELTEQMLAQPRVVEVDGQRVENQSLGDLLKVASYFASKRARIHLGSENLALTGAGFFFPNKVIAPHLPTPSW